MASLYLSISCKLDSPGFMALTIHLNNTLVLAVFGSTSPKPPYFFLRQHSLQLTLVRVSYSYFKTYCLTHFDLGISIKYHV